MISLAACDLRRWAGPVPFADGGKVIMKYTHILAALMLLSVVAESAASDGASLGQDMEPEVVITPRDQGRVKEYRANGQLYMIEVIPTKGAPYYLIDNDGDGLLESRQNQLGSNFMIPRWSVLRW